MIDPATGWFEHRSSHVYPYKLADYIANSELSRDRKLA